MGNSKLKNLKMPALDDGKKAPADGHERKPNAVGCKPNWCTNICYLLIGWVFIGAIEGAAWAPSTIGMWNLAPDLISSTIWALGPPLMTGGYTEAIPRDTVSYPPA